MEALETAFVDAESEGAACGVVSLFVQGERVFARRHSRQGELALGVGGSQHEVVKRDRTALEGTTNPARGVQFVDASGHVAALEG